jgi:hypothetical protein
MAATGGLHRPMNRVVEGLDQYIDINQVLLQDRSFREYYSRL